MALDEDFTDEVASSYIIGMSYAVEDLFAFLCTGDNMILAEYLEMLAEVGLRKIEHGLDFSDGDLLVPKQMNYF